MRRTFWRALVFWSLLAPTLLYAFLLAGTLPTALVRAALGTTAQSPAARIAGGLVALATAVASIALVWWVWRIYRGDPPRRPELPSKKVLVTTGVLLGGWVLAMQLVEPRGSTRVIDAPWLREPVSIQLPQEAELPGREVVVEVSLWISDSGEIVRHEFIEASSPQLQAAVADAIGRMHVNTDALGAESYPHEKRLRMQFVAD